MTLKISHNDSVLFLQQVFRTVLDAMAHPGTCYQLPDTEHVQESLGQSPFFSGTLGIAQTVLDTQVSYAVVSPDQIHAQATRYLATLTYAATNAVERANFIFITSNASALEVKSALKLANPGTLLDPYTAATVIVECNNKSFEEDNPISKLEHVLEVSGPGVKSTQRFVVDRVDWLFARIERQDEYPLGIDIILVGEDGSVVGVPRSSRVERLSSSGRVSS